VREQIAMLQPSSAKASATALPIPVLEAVTKATLPLIPRSID
jgi:hypothetical protein